MPDPYTNPSSTDSRFRTDHLRAEVTDRSIRGGAVTMGAQALKVAAQFGSIMILARLLSPSDFGLFAVVLALLASLELFKDMGLSAATVQRPEIGPREVSALFWLNLGLGTSLALLFALAAPGLAWIYDSPQVRDIMPVAGLSLVMTGLAAQHLALLRRQMRFRCLAAVQTGADLTGMAAAIAAAFGGLGIWALVVQRLVWAAVLAVGSTATSGWRPGRPARLGEVRGLVAFGANATGGMLLGRAASTIDKLVIGAYWGPALLGLFERAQKLVMMPVQNVNTPLSTVALPMLSRLVDEPDRYRGAYLAVAERLAMLTAPAAALLFSAGEAVAVLILGPQWRDAGAILSWLGLALLYMPVTYTLSWLYMSQNRTREMLRANIVNVTLTLAGLGIALPFGPEVIAAVYALTGGLVRAPLLFWLAGRQGPVGIRTFAGIFRLPLVAAVAGVGANLTLAHFTRTPALPVWGEVAIYAAAAGGAALLVYAVTAHGRSMLVETLRLPRLAAKGAGA